MKKATKSAPKIQEKKGFFALAGEAFHVLGEEIVEGKDKVVEVAAEKFAAVKRTVHNITHTKEKPVKRNVKKTAKKVVRKAVKTTSKKPARVGRKVSA